MVEMDDFTLFLLSESVDALQSEDPTERAVAFAILRSEFSDFKKTENNAQTDDKQYYHESYYLDKKPLTQELTTEEDHPPNAWSGSHAEM